MFLKTPLRRLTFLGNTFSPEKKRATKNESDDLLVIRDLVASTILGGLQFVMQGIQILYNTYFLFLEHSNISCGKKTTV